MQTSKSSRQIKMTQNINKDKLLNDLPEVHPDFSAWESRWSNYISSNIGDIVPIYCEEMMPGQRLKIDGGMLSQMQTPIAPLFNAQYTEFRAFFVPHRLSADLLNGYKDRKSPWVKVFGEDNVSTNSNIVVPLSEQKLPDINAYYYDPDDGIQAHLKPFGGLADALDIDFGAYAEADKAAPEYNFLNLAAYELIYQKAYRDENRESATSSSLYRFLFDIYHTNAITTDYNDSFHVASREKDYFTGAKPFTLKASEPVTIPVAESAPVVGTGKGLGLTNGSDFYLTSKDYSVSSSNTIHGLSANANNGFVGATASGSIITGNKVLGVSTDASKSGLMVDLTSASGISIEQLRILIKTQELLEKDAMYGTRYTEQLNAHFGVKLVDDTIQEPVELFKTTITSQMQAVLQTSTTENEQSILGTIGANATTESPVKYLPDFVEFKEWGYLVICATHKAQNAYDMRYFKPKHIFKKSRFDWYTPELNNLGFQPVQVKELGAASFDTHQGGNDEPVGYNEAWAEYRYVFNKVHGMLEPSRANSLAYWTLALSGYADIQSMYKQSTTELDRALSRKSITVPQFFDAFGFIETNIKPMTLHSEPGMDGVI